MTDVTEERVRELLASSTADEPSAELIAAALEIAQAYLDKCEEIENLWREIADGSVHP